MQRWHAPFLGLKNIPKSLTDFEIDYFFQLNEDEMAAIHLRYADDTHRLAVGIQLGFIKLTGTLLNAVQRIPRVILAHVSKQLDIRAPSIATIRALYRSRRTLFEHQRWATDYLGFRSLDERREQALLQRLREEAAGAISVDALIGVTQGWLYDQRVLIPATRRLKTLAAQANASAEGAQYRAVCRCVPQRVRNRWESALYRRQPRYELPIIDWLKAPPKRRAPGHFDEELAKIEFLKELGVHRYEPRIPLARQRFYGSRMRRRRPYRLRALSRQRRTLELVCFLRTTLLDRTDVVLNLTEKKIAEIWTKARHAVDRRRVQEAVRGWHVLNEVERLVHDDTLSSDAVRDELKTLLATVTLKRTQSRAAAVREELSHVNHGVRRLLKQLTLFDFEAEADHPVLEALATLRTLYERGETHLPSNTLVSFAQRWEAMMSNLDRQYAMRAYEAATLYALRVGLRSGGIWVGHSANYCHREALLIPKKTWEKQRQKHYRALGVSRSAKTYLEPLLAMLRMGLRAVDEAVANGQLTIDDDGLHMRRIEGEDESSQVKRTRRRFQEAIGRAHLPELMLEVDSHTRFSWTLLGRAPQSERELLAIYGAVLALATHQDATEIAHMIPGLPETYIIDAMALLEENHVLADANALAVTFQRRHAIVNAWGDGTLASADMLSLEMSRQLWNARVDPRRRTHAVGTYTHLLDQWGIVYDQPIVVTERQAGVAIEGVVRQQEIAIAQLAVDTHGFTNFGMGISRPLGFDLCPRLKGMRHRRLFVPKGVRVPPRLKTIVDRNVSLKDFENEWDGLVRLAASIYGGWTSAVLALRRFGSAASAHPVYRAGTALGKINRTIFLCDYFAEPAFRRLLNRMLAHGESIHTLQHAVRYGTASSQRARRHQELVAMSGALTLGEH